MPDTLAFLFFCIGFYFSISDRKKLSLLFITLAVTQKALFAFAASPVIFVSLFSRNDFNLNFIKEFLKKDAIKPLLNGAVQTWITALPFIIWLLILSNKGIADPFGFDSKLENRHSGSFDILFNLEYYTRLLKWWVPKGIGVPLFIGALYALYTHVRQNVGFKKHQMMIVLWAFSVFPYWLLVRESSFIHDYYFLPFFFPWAWLGMKGILMIPNRYLRTALIIASIVIGMKESLLLKEVAKEHSEPPKFCQAEAKSF
jgi:hypothetical protein